MDELRQGEVRQAEQWENTTLAFLLKEIFLMVKCLSSFGASYLNKKNKSFFFFFKEICF